VVLLAGEPGVGKSTLLLDVASRAPPPGGPCSTSTGEESAAQVRLRAERIGALGDRLFLTAETDLATVLGHVEAVDPDLLVVDSVQTVASEAVDGTAGNVSQVREGRGVVDPGSPRPARWRRSSSGTSPRTGRSPAPGCWSTGRRGLPVRGRPALAAAAGARGENRYGPTDEVGCFDLSDVGIVGLADPSGLFLSRHESPVPGTAVTVTLEGRRPLVAEVQALVAPSALSNPRRATSGLDASRVAMVLAVLERRAQVRLASMDTYIATVGGVRLVEPAADLAVTLAVASAARDMPLLAGTVAVGEVGLAGEVRPVTGVARRLAEAARLGFTTAIVPAGSDGSAPAGMTVHEVPDVRTALARATTHQ
jgi:DNA repair protein RadA/Sms